MGAGAKSKFLSMWKRVSEKKETRLGAPPILASLLWMKDCLLFSFFFHQSRNLDLMGSGSFSTIAFILFLISVFSRVVFATDESPLYYICGNETTDGDYRTNLASLLDSLASKASNNTFYNDTLNHIYGLYLCRGDVNATSCQSCVKTAVGQVIQDCQYNQTGIIWYDHCMLRYSNESFFGKMDTVPGFMMWNVNNRTDPNEGDVGAQYLMQKLETDVPTSDFMFSRYKIDSPINKSVILYGLGQCTRDINATICGTCLSLIVLNLQECCAMKVGYRYMGPNCNMRYERYLFYDEGGSANPLPPAEPPRPPVYPPAEAEQPPPPVDPGDQLYLYFGGLKVFSLKSPDWCVPQKYQNK